MNKTWLILDANYLCHRAKHTTGELSFHGRLTGTVYGLLRDVFALQEQFRTNNVVFCWDSRVRKRREIFPDYKSHRGSKQKMTKKEIRFEKAFRVQMKHLRRDYLPMIGYRNIFHQTGYESDDLIASVCHDLRDNERAIIVTADHDMFQCIQSNIQVYDPRTRRMTTLQSFHTTYGIIPPYWIYVKAIGGCNSDNVPGLPGIGEKTAIKFLLEKLPRTSKAFRAIKHGIKVLARNLQLVTLPYPGTKSVRLQRNRLSEDGWRKVCHKLGLKSLHDRSLFRIER